MAKKIILHLCADIGSDSRFYQLDDNYEVILVGEKIGVENYEPPENVHGVIANPVCTEFSTAQDFRIKKDLDKGMFLVKHCQRIIEQAKPKWWVIENPANGRLKEFLGKPKMTYHPWRYGSPWTKHTALWGSFKVPAPLFDKWEDVPKLPLYIKPMRSKPGLDCLHKSAVDLIPEMQWAKKHIKTDADIRSMCSQGFAKSFYEANP